MSNNKKERIRYTNLSGVIGTGHANDFNKKKEELKSFSESYPDESKLPTVPESKIFGLMSYKVTGNDLNKLTECIQNIMIEQNKALLKTIKEFGVVYETFSELDKEYIQGILISIEAAKEANKKALDGIEKSRRNENDIRGLIDGQKKIIQSLIKFKEKIENIKHLSDIDNIYEEFSIIQNSIEIAEKVQDQKFIELNSTINKLTVSQLSLENNLNDIKKTQTNQSNTFEKLVFDQNKNISVIETSCTENNNNITNLDLFTRNNIKAIYDKIELNNTQLNVKLNAINTEFIQYITKIESMIEKQNLKSEEELKHITTRTQLELSKNNDDMLILSSSIKKLSASLKITQAIFFISICITITLVIFGLNGMHL